MHGPRQADGAGRDPLRQESGNLPADQLIATFLGEPLYAMVQNLGQADNSYVAAADTPPTRC